MDRYTVEKLTAWGRTIFNVIDNALAGERDYVVARCDGRSDAYHIARLLNAQPAGEKS